jgi:leucyl-tRNA synthetase
VEHAVLHLLYARFWHKVMYDVGLVHTKEPFQRLFNQGMILAYSYKDEQGKYYHPSEVEQREGVWYVKGTDTAVSTQVEKMSKSKKNVVDPMEIVDQYGADTLRIYEMFMGPLEQVKPWQTSGCEGIFRFLSRAWRLFINEETGELRPFGATQPDARRALHNAIKESSEGIEALKFNTPVSKMMEFVNACKNETPSREDAERFLLILSPYAAHMAEELWQRFGHGASILKAAWPDFDPSALVADTVEIAVQVGGKLRGTLSMPREADAPSLLAAAKAHPKVAPLIEGKVMVKEIVVPGRLVNLVVR